MAYAILESSPRAANPLDVVEQVTLANGWPFERQGEEEIVVEVAGDACTHRLWFAWHAERETLHLSCSFEMKVPEPHRAAVFPLLALINARLWLGHFNFYADEGMVLFRHTMLLHGGPGASPAQLKELIEAALTQCDRFYPVFQYVIWGGMAPGEAIDAALIETVGEA